MLRSAQTERLQVKAWTSQSQQNRSYPIRVAPLRCPATGTAMASPERGLRPKAVESESSCLAQLLLTVTPSERLTYISETSFLERSASQIANAHCLQPQFEHKLLFSRRPCTDFLQCHAKKSPELATFTFSGNRRLLDELRRNLENSLLSGLAEKSRTGPHLRKLA